MGSGSPPDEERTWLLLHRTSGSCHRLTPGLAAGLAGVVGLNMVSWLSCVGLEQLFYPHITAFLFTFWGIAALGKSSVTLSGRETGSPPPTNSAQRWGQWEWGQALLPRCPKPPPSRDGSPQQCPRASLGRIPPQPGRWGEQEARQRGSRWASSLPCSLAVPEETQS